GTAAGQVMIDAGDPARAEATLAAVEHRFGSVEVVRHSPMRVPGLTGSLDVRAQDPHGPYGHTLLALRHGRYPSRAGEVALTAGAAEELDAQVGSTVAIDRTERTVVGIVENPKNLKDEFALLAPDQPGTQWTVLIGDLHGFGGNGGGGQRAQGPGATSATGA